MDFTDVLYPEIVDKIFSYLDASELSVVSCCCVRWRELTNKDALWLHHSMVRGWLRFGLNGDIIRENHLNIKMSNVGGNSPVFQLDVPEGTSLSPLCKWKNIFIRVQYLNRNWKKGRYTVAPVLRGHKEKVTAINCNGKFVVSGSEDKTLRLWDMSQATCVKKLDGHMDTINTIIWKGNTIVTGCADSSIRVIDSSNFSILFSLQGHGGSVEHMTLVGKVLVSAATDRTIRLWYLPDRKLVHILRGHNDDVEEHEHLYREMTAECILKCMSSNGNHVVTGSWDKTLILWDIEHAELVHTYHGHTEVVTCCYFDGKKIISGSADSTLRIWNLSPPKCVYVLKGHDSDVYCLAANGFVIASGSSDSTVRVWSHQGVCKHVMHGHLGIVRCLYINDERLVSGGDQKKIIVWDYRKGVQMNIVHRQPTLLHLMWLNETKLITASPEGSGTIAVISYW